MKTNSKQQHKTSNNGQITNQTEDIETLSNLVPITPDSLLILSNGTTHLIPSHKFSAFYEECMPPEFIDKVTFNLPQLEKVRLD